MRESFSFVLAIIAILLTAGLTGCRGGKAPTGEVSRGQALYEKNCAVCHGKRGDGKGEAAYLLQPKPRNFRAGKFRLVTSQNLQPTREDVFRTIKNGMPGTPMPSWEHLPEADRWALADYILELNRQGWIDLALGQGDTREAAEEYAKEMTQPGEPIAVPPEPAVTPDGLEQGRKYYITACSKCHGEDGKGKRDPTWRTAEGFPTWSRNLSHGVFKGGREGRQLYLRFFTGLPGTPMPSSDLDGQQVWQVVHYIQGLSDPAAQERARVRSFDLPVRHVQTLPSGPDDAVWQTVAGTRIPLMALWWHEGYIDGVRVKVVEDGEQLAFRLEWNDPSRDVEGVRQQSFPDGAAIELTASDDPPLFAMGAAGEVVTIWHWKALWDKDREAFQDVATAYPDMVTDLYYGSDKGWESGPLDDTEFITAVKAHNPIAAEARSTSVEHDRAAGLGTLTPQDSDQPPITGIAHWKNGVWRLQLTRQMKLTGDGTVSLAPGAHVSVAFAVWDGSRGDRDGQKSVSIWNSLKLE